MPTYSEGKSVALIALAQSIRLARRWEGGEVMTTEAWREKRKDSLERSLGFIVGAMSAARAHDAYRAAWAFAEIRCFD